MNETEPLYTQWKKDLDKRKSYNMDLLEELKVLVSENPEQRFGQIICNYFMGGNKDSFFYEEPWDTLNRVENKSKVKLF